MYMMQTWTGEQGLQVYSEVHQTLGNIIIHALFLPVITYSILRWIYVLFDRVTARAIIFGILLFYGNFYSLMGFYDTMIWFSLTLPLVIIADSDKDNTRLKAGVFFLLPLLVQEIIGHTLFEGVNSRFTFSHVTKAILYTPMFYSRAAHNFASLFFGSSIGGILVFMAGSFASWSLLTRKLSYKELVLPQKIN